MYGLKPVPFKLTHYRMAERLTLVYLALLHLLVVTPVNETAELSCVFRRENDGRHGADGFDEFEHATRE
jgi:hypothetical protein